MCSGVGGSLADLRYGVRTSARPLPAWRCARSGSPQRHAQGIPEDPQPPPQRRLAGGGAPGPVPTGTRGGELTPAGRRGIRAAALPLRPDVGAGHGLALGRCGWGAPFPIRRTVPASACGHGEGEIGRAAATQCACSPELRVSDISSGPRSDAGALNLASRGRRAQQSCRGGLPLAQGRRATRGLTVECA